MREASDRARLSMAKPSYRARESAPTAESESDLGDAASGSDDEAQLGDATPEGGHGIRTSPPPTGCAIPTYNVPKIQYQENGGGRAPAVPVGAQSDGRDLGGGENSESTDHVRENTEREDDVLTTEEFPKTYSGSTMETCDIQVSAPLTGRANEWYTATKIEQ